MTNVQSLEYKEGTEAWAEGIPASQNPYRFPGEQADNEKFENWADGWMDARESDSDELDEMDD